MEKLKENLPRILPADPYYIEMEKVTARAYSNVLDFLEKNSHLRKKQTDKIPFFSTVAMSLGTLAKDYARDLWMMEKQEKITIKNIPPFKTCPFELEYSWRCCRPSVVTRRLNELRRCGAIIKIENNEDMDIWLHPDIILENQKGFERSLEPLPLDPSEFPF